MTKIQLDSGPSSSATHRLTQSSNVANRHTVERPTNLAIEEAAQAVTKSTGSTHSAPSRLVNLRLHAADLVAPEPSQPAAENQPEIDTQSPIVPRVLEFGSSTPITNSEVEDLANMIDLNQVVPAEAPIEEFTSNIPNNSHVQDAAVASTASTATNELAIATTSAVVTTDPVSNQDLAMSIATDYAAASLGASISPAVADTSSNSIDVIARAASEAIAAIRTATGPEEIAKQIISLQSFAKTLREDSSMPEMVELSSTIEKFVSVAMKSTAVQDALEQQQQEQQSVAVNAKKSTAKTPAAKSTLGSAVKSTLSKRPAAKSTSSANIAISKPTPIRRTTATHAQPTSAKRRATASAKPRPTLVKDEDQALRSALRSVADIDDTPISKKPAKRVRRKGGGKRFALAVFCAVFCVAIVVYIVGSNIPDISVKVAAIQTGVEASYPSYIPRDYSLSDINSEEGKLTMTFNGPDQASFSITEEKSSWDSTTLLRSYVEPTWKDNYITTHEQGITIYISGSNAAWVNGGVLYKINANGNPLTKKQLRNIVTSM